MLSRWRYGIIATSATRSTSTESSCSHSRPRPEAMDANRLLSILWAAWEKSTPWAN